MLDIPAALIANDADTPTGVWTPVTEGVSTSRAQAAARTMMRKLTNLEEDNVAVVAGFIAAALIISRATTGGSLDSFIRRSAPSPETATKVQLAHWQRLVTKLESLSEEASTQEQATHLDQAAADLHNACTLMRSLSDSEQARLFDEMNYAVADVFTEQFPRSYTQPWDAPDTLEVVVLRRDQL